MGSLQLCQHHRHLRILLFHPLRQSPRQHCPNHVSAATDWERLVYAVTGRGSSTDAGKFCADRTSEIRYYRSFVCARDIFGLSAGCNSISSEQHPTSNDHKQTNSKTPKHRRREIGTRSASSTPTLFAFSRLASLKNKANPCVLKSVTLFQNHLEKFLLLTRIWMRAVSPQRINHLNAPHSLEKPSGMKSVKSFQGRRRRGRLLSPWTKKRTQPCCQCCSCPRGRGQCRSSR
ncbi:hypothetical protein BC829DRAFT_114324 [Chytridium lagenaria]|nr:hypothetical protein BC829DRAFT_114324 [Chytridium lagenaria]